MNPQTQTSDGSFEVPQLALGRYLELLQRRWWQVVPVSLVGLVIGALVASSVPRYYSVNTKVQYSGSPFDREVGTAEDPMADEFRALAARITSPELVLKTMRELGWPEASDPDPEKVRTFVQKVTDEIVVNDLNRGDERRTFFQAAIRYRDLDGARAESFVNKLTENWMAGRLATLKRQANERFDQINSELTAAQTARDVARRSMVQLERDHDLDLSLRSDPRSGRIGPELQERSQLEAGIAEMERTLRRQNAELRDLQRELASGRIPQLIDKKPEPEAPPQEDPKQAARAALVAGYTKALLTLQGMTPAHPNYKTVAGQVSALKAQGEALGIAFGPEGNVEQDDAAVEQEANPAYAEARKQEVDLQREIELTEEALREKQERLVSLQGRIDRLPQIWKDWEGFKYEFDQAVARITELEEERNDLRKDAASLQSGSILDMNRAFAPPAPTDPSILFLALVGSVLGLGAAIGLILLWDFVQSTFKTVEDVERGLPVPVLGTMAHLETREEREQAANTRRRVSLTAAGFLVLMVSIVTVYYVAPTRLPPFVIEVFDLLLGAPGP